MIRIGTFLDTAAGALDGVVLAVAPAWALRRELARKRLAAIRRAAEHQEVVGQTRPPARLEIATPYRHYNPPKTNDDWIDD